jgi:hypothetical protein
MKHSNFCATQSRLVSSRLVSLLDFFAFIV